MDTHFHQTGLFGETEQARNLGAGKFQLTGHGLGSKSLIIVEAGDLDGEAPLLLGGRHTALSHNTSRASEQGFITDERKLGWNKCSLWNRIGSQLNERSFLLTYCSACVILDQLPPLTPIRSAHLASRPACRIASAGASNIIHSPQITPLKTSLWISSCPNSSGLCC